MNIKSVYQISDKQFIEAFNSCDNIHQALKKMKLSSRGHAYDNFRKRAEKLGLNLKKFRSGEQKQIRNSLHDTRIIQACQEASSRQGTLKILGLKPKINSNVKWIDRKIQSLKIDTKHWLGQGHLRGKTHNWTPSKPIEYFLGYKYVSYVTLRKKIIKENILPYKCSTCGIDSWRGIKLSLHLDHIDGDRKNNVLENLRFLCPNCHSQTETYCRGK